MANPLHCDATDCPDWADVLVSRIANGETLAWCDAHFVQMCEAVASAAAQPEADEADAEALRRLGAAADAEAFPSSVASSDADDPPGESRSTLASAPAEPVAGEDGGAGDDEAPKAVPGGHGRSGLAG